LGLVGRQRPRRHLLGVVHAADRQRPVRVALLEGDHHLMADTRDVHRAHATAGPRLADAHPARVAAVALGLAVPVKLHCDATLFVTDDPPALGPHYQRRLHPIDARPRSDARWPVGSVPGDTAEAVAVLDGLGVVTGTVASRDASLVLHAGQQVGAVAV